MDPVFFGETFDQVISMLPDALHEIAGNADVKRSISLAGEDVNGGLQDLWLLEEALNPLQQIFAPAERELPLADVFTQTPVQREQSFIGCPQRLKMALADLRLDFKQEVAVANWRRRQACGVFVLKFQCRAQRWRDREVIHINQQLKV